MVASLDERTNAQAKGFYSKHVPEASTWTREHSSSSLDHSDQQDSPCLQVPAPQDETNKTTSNETDEEVRARVEKRPKSSLSFEAAFPIWAAETMQKSYYIRYFIVG
jgi:hypothetical protein